MGMYDPVNHIGMWAESFKGNGFMLTSPSTILEVDTKLDNQVIVVLSNETIPTLCWNNSSMLFYS